MVVAVSCAASCSKDGKYKPERKIAQIDQLVERNDGTITSFPYEMWNWNGDLLKSIDFYDGGCHIGTETYEYEKDRLVSSTMGNTKAVYFYDGKRISRIEIEEISSTAMNSGATFEFKYERNKISRIIYTFRFKYNYDCKDCTMGFLRHFLPDNVCHIIKNDVKKGVAKSENPAGFGESVSTYIYDLTWDGKNVVRLDRSHYTNTDPETVWSDVTEMTYDKQKNPFQKLFTYVEYDYMNSRNETVLSANNVLYSKVTIPDFPEYYDNQYFEYTYDEDGYPVEYIATHDDISGFDGTPQHFSSTYRIKYCE